MHGSLEVLQLLHERLVDLKAAGRVDDDHVIGELLRLGKGLPCDFDRVDLPALEYVDADVSAHHLQLIDCCRTVDVAGDEQDLFALLFQI